MPLSNRNGEGLENRIAEELARDLGFALRLEPVISAAARRKALAHPLQFSTAGWQVAVAFPGHAWKRVPCAQWC